MSIVYYISNCLLPLGLVASFAAFAPPLHILPLLLVSYIPYHTFVDDLYGPIVAILLPDYPSCSHSFCLVLHSCSLSLLYFSIVGK